MNIVILTIILVLFLLFDKMYFDSCRNNIDVIEDHLSINDSELIKSLDVFINDMDVKCKGNDIYCYYLLNNKISLFLVLTKSDHYVKHIELSLKLEDDTKENDKELGVYIGKLINLFNLNPKKTIRKLKLDKVIMDHNKSMSKNNVLISFRVLHERIIFSICPKNSLIGDRA